MRLNVKLLLNASATLKGQGNGKRFVFPLLPMGDPLIYCDNPSVSFADSSLNTREPSHIQHFQRHRD